MLFLTFAQTAATIRSLLKTGEKVQTLVDLLRSIEPERDLQLVTTWFAHGPYPPSDQRTFSVGGATLRTAWDRFSGDGSAEQGSLDAEIFVACRTMAGGTVEAVRMLLDARGHRPDEGLSPFAIDEVQGLFDTLAETSTSAARIEALLEIWRRMTSLEIEFFLRLLGRGPLGIGLSTGLVEHAVATAFERSVDRLRQAAMVEGDLGRAAIRARDGALEDVQIAPLSPIDFMLASPLERRMEESGTILFVPDTTIEIADYIIEDKLDGVRAQAHIGLVEGRRRTLLTSRNQGELTDAFPDVVAQLEPLPTGLVLDGEIVAVDDAGEVAHFNRLQQRLGVKKPAAKLLAAHPALFIPYDLLVLEGRSLLDRPIEERRALLERLSASHPLRLPLPIQRSVDGWEGLEEEFDAARRRGSEGLVLKRRGSRYEAGKRGKSWIKAKKEAGAIDAVIRYATGGTGRRSGTMSDFTFGIWKSDASGERRLVNIGRAYGGFTNEELAELNRRLLPLRRARYGGTWEVEPQIVCELVYDYIQPNGRAEAGYSLRFPRIRRIRWDLGLDGVDTVEDVERLWREDLERGGGGGLIDPS